MHVCVRDVSNMMSIFQCGPHDLGANVARAVARLGVDATFHTFSLTKKTPLHRDRPCDSWLQLLFYV